MYMYIYRQYVNVIIVINPLLLKGVSHTQDYGEREVLLPLLRLLKECLTMVSIHTQYSCTCACTTIGCTLCMYVLVCLVNGKVN